MYFSSVISTSLLLVTTASAIRVTFDCDGLHCLPRLSRSIRGFPFAFGASSIPSNSRDEPASEKPTSDPALAIPTICQTSEFRVYGSFKSNRDIRSHVTAAPTKQECCMICYHFGDCLAFAYDAGHSKCTYHVGTDLVTNLKDESLLNPICPLGLGNGHLEFPHYPTHPGFSGYEYGPCLTGQPRGWGLEHQQIKHGSDQQILGLHRAENIEDPYFEMVKAAESS